MPKYVMGVDVGTGSARAGLFTPEGELIAGTEFLISIWKPRPDFVEQSSEDIWESITQAVRMTLETAEAAAADVVGISYDATCSLVVLDSEGNPLTVDTEGDPRRNIIVWMDHRALDETAAINSGDWDVLRYVGGRLSPEMETPKLLWIKNHLPDTWKNAGKFLDLADYLTYRSTGIDARSLCTVVCKWTYLGHEGGRWDQSFFDQIGLGDLFEHDRVVQDVRPMGSYLGNLTQEAAEQLGLTTNCAVGVGIIDAHAGGLGVLGAVWKENQDSHNEDNHNDTNHDTNHNTNHNDKVSHNLDTGALETALALIGGTSNCHMAVSREPIFIEGIWGPYYGAMVPGMWLTEGGQSAAGSAIDHVIADHANAPSLRAQALSENVSVYQLLNAELDRQCRESGVDFPALLTRDLHVLPYFLGNRSPNADPYARACIDGLTLDESISSHALIYYATLQAVAYGTRDIVRAMNESGYRIDTLFVTGGAIKNPVWLQEHADATGLTLVLPQEPQAVLLGTAILAATAAGIYESVQAAMKAMSHTGQVVRPNPATAEYHAAKFDIFRSLYQQQLQRRKAMQSFG